MINLVSLVFSASVLPFGLHVVEVGDSVKQCVSSDLTASYHRICQDQMGRAAIEEWSCCKAAAEEDSLLLESTQSDSILILPHLT